MDPKLEELLREIGKNLDLKEIGPFLYTGDERTRAKYPIFSGNYDELQYVPQGRAFFSTHEKPVLATSGLSNCIGVLAYDPKRKLAFLGHTDAFSFLYTGDDRLGSPSQSAHIDQLVRGIRERDGKYTFEIKLVKGNFPDKKFIETIKRHIERATERGELHILSLEEIDVGYDGSIAIDARTGRLFSYDSKLDPNPKPKGFGDVYLRVLKKEKKNGSAE